MLYNSIEKRVSIISFIVVFSIVFTNLLPITGYTDEPDISVTDASVSEPIDNLADLALEDLLRIEIVSASKKLQTLSDAPASVVVITAEDIKRYGYRNVGEALRRAIGFYVSNDLNYEYLGVRGFGRPGDYNTRVLLLIDGHKLNDPLYDMAPMGEDNPIDIESIDRIEIVRGPGSSLWGTSAMLAVINIITKTGSKIGNTRVVGEYGSHDRQKLYIEYGKQHENGLDIALNISAMDSKGRRAIYFPEFDDPSTNDGWAVGIDDESAERGGIKLAYKGLKLTFNAAKRTKNIPTASYYNVFNHPGIYTVDERSFAELSYEKSMSSKQQGTLLARIYHDRYLYYGDYYYDGGNETPNQNKDSAESKCWGGEIRYLWNPVSKLSAIVGFETQNAYDITQRNYDNDPYYDVYIDSYDSFSLKSYYTQLDYALNKSLRVVGGARFDDDSRFGGHWSPRGAFILNAGTGSTFKLLYGEAFRAPNVYESSFAGNIYTPNPNIKPENISTTELVWERRIGNTSRLATSLFHFNLSNIITQVELPDETIQFQNKGSIRVRGLEVNLDRQFKNNSSAHLGFTLLDVLDKETNTNPSNSPEILAVAGMTIPILQERFYISPEIQCVGNRKTLAGNKTGSATLANINVSTKTIGDAWQASFGVYNLFDSDIFAPGSSEHIQDKIPQDGRTFRLQINRRF